MMTQASRHQGTAGVASTAVTPDMRSRARCTLASSRRLSAHRAFSLIEVLLAIFILGIGVISVAALFPAGIVQQRQSADDSIGPTVANTAMGIIRSKLKATDFGTFEDFYDTSGIPLAAPWSQASPVGPTATTVRGDWPWLRPALILQDDNSTQTFPVTGSPGPRYDQGGIDIFGWYPASGSSVATAREFDSSLADPATPLFGIPYNRANYSVPPAVFITQSERYYPQVGKTYVNATDTPKPQYVWDCAFRRFEGKILVAIFVYRAATPGSNASLPFVSTALTTGSNTARPPIPYRLDLWDFASQTPFNTSFCANPWNAGGIDAFVLTPLDNAQVVGAAGGTAYDPANNPEQAWQEPRQWILDQNNCIHRVVGQYRSDLSDPVEIELSRPVPQALGLLDTTSANPPVTGTPYFYVGLPMAPSGFVLNNIVTHLWYIPQEMDIDANFDGTPDTRVVLTPVYVTVKEL